MITRQFKYRPICQERIRRFYEQGFQIVIFGKKDHAEVIGLLGQTNNEAVVVRTPAEAGAVDASRKTVLFSQTTMDRETFAAVADVLRARIREFVVGTFEESAIEFHAKDTICGQVSGRDGKLREFARSLGKVLYEICREANANTHFVEDEKELRAEWFRGAATAGVSGATSTPQWLMENVKKAIEAMQEHNVIVK